MENKTKSRFQTVVNYVTVVLFMALLLTPMLLLVTTGEDKLVLENEKQYEAPAFSVSDFASSAFQTNFELWFSTKYPMRGNVVNIYRQIQYDTSNIGFDITAAFLAKAPDASEDTSQDAENLVDGTQESEEGETPAPYSDFNPLYVDVNRRLYEREAIEPNGYKGNAQVVIGKSGYLYENGYINEFYGYSQKYRDCSDIFIEERVAKLAYIQKRLKEMGKEFVLVITPSKASEYERFIPDWYKAQNTEPENYVRPVERLVTFLDKEGVNYLRCSDYYEEIGLDETFPVTGIHWNKLAAYEASRQVVNIFEELSGTTVRNIISNKIVQSSQISGFGSNDADIFGIVYSGVNSKDAIRDKYYYWPEILTEDYNVTDTFGMLLQGGSFSWDIKYYLEQYRLIHKLSQFDYNNWTGDANSNPLRNPDKWKQALEDVDYVVFECNEQYVCMMGTDHPQWGAADKEPLSNQNSDDVYESLYNYLKSIE